MRPEDAEVVADLRLQSEQRWCRRLRQLMDFMPDTLSLMVTADGGLSVVKAYPDGNVARFDHVRTCRVATETL